MQQRCENANEKKTTEQSSCNRGGDFVAVVVAKNELTSGNNKEIKLAVARALTSVYLCVCVLASSFTFIIIIISTKLPERSKLSSIVAHDQAEGSS